MAQGVLPFKYEAGGIAGIFEFGVGDGIRCEHREAFAHIKTENQASLKLGDGFSKYVLTL